MEVEIFVGRKEKCAADRFHFDLNLHIYQE